MARTKPKATATPPANRPWPVTVALAAVLVAVSGCLLYLMRVEVVASGAIAPHVKEVEGRVFPDGTRLREVYTGVGPVDWFLTLLVGAFLAGPAGWDPVIRLQQIYLLVTFGAFVGIMAVESCRIQNRWRVLSFTTLWSLLYQTIGGGIIIPLWVLAHVVASRTSSYRAAGRAVPQAAGRALLPAVILGYVVPTVAMYAVPSDGDGGDLTQWIIAAWQPAPIYVNAILVLATFSLFPSGPTPSTSSGGGSAAADVDIPALKRLYGVLALLAAATHAYTLYAILGPQSGALGRDGEASALDILAAVFVPSGERRFASAYQAVHYVFQWDVWGIYGSGLLWCLIELHDLRRLLPSGPGLLLPGLVPTTLLLAAGSAAIGPAAVMAVFWLWREDKLALVERRLGAHAKVA